MNNIWIACDWHLWSDKRNIHHPYRSISNIGRLADQYTQDIDDTDIFIHLGDLSDIGSTNQEKLESIIKSIPGYKILCKGNHDTESDEFYKMIGFDEVCEICIIHHVVFSHKPVKVPLDMINVHGHLHTEKMSTLGYQHINAFDSNYSTHPILLEDLLEKAPYQKPEEWATTDLKHVDEKFEKYTSLVSGDQYTKIIDLTDRVKLYPMDENVETAIFKTPEELSRWMRSNIHYANFSHLKSSNEVLTSKSGSCHDQVVFEYNELKKMGKKPKILFFIAYKEGSNQGGMTHSLVYYNENNKIKWFENSWAGLEGIHTYDSLSELKDDIKKYYSNMPDAKNFPELEFKSVRISDFKTGMSLGNFVSGIMNEAAIQWKDDKGNDIPKVCPKCGSKVGVFLRGEPVFLCTNKECGKYFGTVPFPENESIDYDLINAGDSIMTEIIFDDLEDVKYFEADDTSRLHPKKEKTRLSTDNDEPIAESMLTYPGENEPIVYYTKEITPESLDRIFNRLIGPSQFHDHRMVKISSGEPGGHNYLKPELIRKLVQNINGVICDTTTAYDGNRNTKDGQLKTMKDHGFRDIADVDVLDGDGETTLKVKDGYILPEVRIGSHVSDYNYHLILFHFKGHAMAGYGGALKNVCIGLASKSGKSQIHTYGNSADLTVGFLDSYDQTLFQKAMVDASKTFIDYMKEHGPVVYINVANNLSVDCDCDAHAKSPCMGDLGIYASLDPVAVDQACIDAVYYAKDSQELIERIESKHGEKILEFAEEKELGSRKYHLVNIDQNSIVESATFAQVKKIVNNIPKEEHHWFYHGDEFKDSSYVKYRDVMYLKNGRGKTVGGFIDIYSFDSDPDVGIVVIALEPAARGTGLATKLVQKALKKLPSLGIKKVIWRADNDNVASQKLAKKLGFTDISDHKANPDQYKYEYVLNEASSISSKFYFISQHGDWNESVIHPRVPSNFMTKNGYEENKTPRVCFSTSIDGCLRALSQNVNGKEFYVYNPEISSKHTVYKPTQKEVPDAKATNEHWILQPVTLHCIGKIRVTGEKGNGIPYKYGDKNQYTAELYDWKWKWIEKYDNDKTINEMAYEDYADHYLQVLRKAANDLNHDEKVWKHLSKVCNVEIEHLPKFTCKLKFSGEPQLCYDMIEDREQVPFEIRCNMEAHLSELCRKLEKDRTERKEYPGVTSMFSVDGDGLIYINLARDLESINEMYLSSLSAYEEDAAQLHTYSKEDKEEVYKKYGIRPVGEYRETDHEKENKDTVESRREKLQEQRKRDLAKARKVKKRKAFVRKVKSHLPGLKNEDTAVDTSDADQYDEPDVESDRLWGDQIRAFKNKWNDQYPVGLVNSVNESYQFEMLDKVYFHDSINESSEDTKLYPVYVMLMHSGTALANAIKTITKSNFSHASISFDSSMKSMYSFGRKSDTNPFIGAFKKEDITTKFFQNKEIPYALYVVPCTKSEIDAMKKRLNFFIQNSTKFKYDFTGLFKNYFGIADNPEYKWFCSRFVADILNAGRPQNDPYVIEPSLMKPEDFTNTNFATYVTGGMLDAYDKSYVDKRTSFILRLERLRRVKEKALNAQNETAIINLDPFDPLQEAVLEYQLTAMNDSDLDNFIDYLTKFKVRYNKDGNLIITRYDYDQLDRYYRRDLKIMDQAQKDGTVSTVKEKLAELHYIYLILSKYYLTPDLQNNPNTSKDVKQAMFDLRSDLLTKTSQYAKWVSIQDPQFNLMEYYQASKYAKHQIPTKLLTMIDKEIITELQ